MALLAAVASNNAHDLHTCNLIVMELLQRPQRLNNFMSLCCGWSDWAMNAENLPLICPRKPAWLSSSASSLPSTLTCLLTHAYFAHVILSGFEISPAIYRAENPGNPKSLKKVSREEFGTPRPRTPKKSKKSPKSQEKV